jgi:AraC-like DNA-binding protein
VVAACVSIESWELSRLSHVRLEPGVVLGPAEAGSWLLVLSGTACLGLADGEHPLESGDAVLVEARTAYAVRSGDGAVLAVADLRPVGVPLPDVLLRRGFARRHPEVAALVSACDLGAACSTRAWGPAFAAILGAALRTGWADEPAVPLADAVVAALLDAVAAEPGRDWTLAAMARAVHLAPSTLAARIRRQTGHSATGLLRDLRMREARQLLREERLPVGRVASRVGYGSTAAFSRAFAAHHGRGPQAWRSDELAG